MPKFSAASLKQLQTCHEDLQKLFFEVIKYRDCTVMEGYRNKVDQEKAFNAGNSKVHFPNGKHNKRPSLACDVYPWPMPLWSATGEFAYFGGFVMGVAEMLFQQGKIKHKLIYGGDFNRNDRVTDQSFFDGGHFEILL